MIISTRPFPCNLKNALRAGGLLVALVLLMPSTSRAQTWMVSTDVYAKIGVMDKFGQLGAYTAKFIVTDQSSGKTYTLVKEVTKGQNGVDVLFPSEASEADYFKTERGEAAKFVPNAFVWECQVGGKKVVGGRFTFSETGNDVTVIDKRK
ncbi:hypothetical protein [Hymenobacter sp. BT491]|uniref:hypothetical protein n=1 Tax=Hymenobacter sp. BT491 TaxID=2766779 RepID=UPI001653CA00|nr:hypothetical protein [Hymenobacter sp. BT491]MBC6988515.1 hypothetical protein [Hymenobacter sp. BT491]